MKNRIKYIAMSTLAIMLASCADSFLQRDPYSSTLSEEQFKAMPDNTEKLMRGVYSMMYDYSDHDEFGERSIDIYGDLLCGDMALTNATYGWFGDDERGFGRTMRNSYLWTYYYHMLRNVNLVVKLTKEQNGDLLDRLADKGVPTTYNSTKSGVTYYSVNASGDTIATYTEAEAKVANIYAQALTMRGYIYSNLLNLFCPESNFMSYEKNVSTPCFPTYNEKNMDDMAQPIDSAYYVFRDIEKDLTTAITYFKAFETIKRDENKKLQVNGPIACGILAYAYLNRAQSKGTQENGKAKYELAKKYAEEAIALSPCRILPQGDIYTDGFNNVNSVSWMWGQDVTTETATGLGSWFGQCDIHSYSYAWSGDTKAIDENLYKLIPEFDARLKWFNDGKANSTYKLCPDGKFFSSQSPNSTKADDIDREWLSDNVFMRIESMYLIAAEASYRLGEDADAIKYLTAITDNRVMEGKETEYAAYKAGLSHDNLLKEIEYNWRVEMWGEGYGLQTFRRLAKEVIGSGERRRGGNHCYDSGSKIEPDDANSNHYYFQMPGAESSYNGSFKRVYLD